MNRTPAPHVATLEGRRPPLPSAVIEDLAARVAHAVEVELSRYLSEREREAKPDAPPAGEG